MAHDLTTVQLTDEQHLELSQLYSQLIEWVGTLYSRNGFVLAQDRTFKTMEWDVIRAKLEALEAKHTELVTNAHALF